MEPIGLLARNLGINGLLVTCMGFAVYTTAIITKEHAIRCYKIRSVYYSFKLQLLRSRK